MGDYFNTLTGAAKERELRHAYSALRVLSEAVTPIVASHMQETLDEWKANGMYETALPTSTDIIGDLATPVRAFADTISLFGDRDLSNDVEHNRIAPEGTWFDDSSGFPHRFSIDGLAQLQAKATGVSKPSFQQYAADVARLIMQDDIPIADIPAAAARIRTDALKANYVRLLGETDQIDITHEGMRSGKLLGVHEDGELWALQATAVPNYSTKLHIHSVLLSQSPLQRVIQRTNDSTQAPSDLLGTLIAERVASWHQLSKMNSGKYPVKPLAWSRLVVGPIESPMYTRETDSIGPIGAVREITNSDPDARILRAVHFFSVSPDREEMNLNGRTFYRQKIIQTEGALDILVAPPAYAGRLARSLGGAIRVLEYNPE